MIIPVASLIAVLLPALLGGRLTRLGQVRLRAVPLMIATLLVQVVIFEVVSGPALLLRLTHVATYLSAALFLWFNRHIPGAWAMAAGTASNGIAIAVNDGELPAGAWAMRVAGLPVRPGFTNSGVQSHPHLLFLGDVFPIPQSLPLSNVFSVGDILVVAGLGYACLRICGTRWNRPLQDAMVTPAVDSIPSPREGHEVPGEDSPPDNAPATQRQPDGRPSG